jgi:uncharacterized protein
MKLDVRKILSGETDRIDIAYTLDTNELPDFDDVTFEPELKITGEFTNNAGYMRLSLLSTLEYDTVCARCLKDIHKSLEVHFDKTVCAEGDIQDEDNDDYIEIHDGMLDIDEALVEDIILDFPIRSLCDDSCKGLCPKCGTDLNTGSCSCVTKEIDPRLAPLLKFFENDDGDK